MALTPTEEAQTRQLIAQEAPLLSLASNEPTITSKLGATKVNLSQLPAASTLADADIMLVRQGTIDKSVALSIVKTIANASAVQKTGDTMTGALAMSGAAINEAQGANIASAATVNLTTATGNYVHIAGTTTITAITLAQGARRRVVFDGILTLTNGVSLILPSAANIVTAAGDTAEFIGEASGVVRCVSYARANGQSLVSQAGTTPSVVQVNTANGYGSTNTMIARFSTIALNQGTDITYADSVTLGGTFTANKDGIYAISSTMTFSNSAVLGASLNSNQLSTAIKSISATNIISIQQTPSGAQYTVSLAWTGFLAANSIVRSHTDGIAASAGPTSFSMTRIG